MQALVAACRWRRGDAGLGDIESCRWSADCPRWRRASPARSWCGTWLAGSAAGCAGCMLRDPHSAETRCAPGRAQYLRDPGHRAGGGYRPGRHRCAGIVPRPRSSRRCTWIRLSERHSTGGAGWRHVRPLLRRNGRAVPGPVDDRVDRGDPGLTWPAYPRAGRGIGRDKLPGVLGALRTGTVDVLVCDRALADVAGWRRALVRSIRAASVSRTMASSASSTSR